MKLVVHLGGVKRQAVGVVDPDGVEDVILCGLSSLTRAVPLPPEELHAVDVLLLDDLQRLPQSKRVDALLFLVDTVRESGQGDRLRTSLEKRWPRETEPQGGYFSVMRISREDLGHVQIDSDTAEGLDDDQMEEIAAKMRGYYLAGEFWEDLEFAAGQVIAEEPAPGGSD